MIQILLNWGEIKENSPDIYARTSNKTNIGIRMQKRTFLVHPYGQMNELGVSIPSSMDFQGTSPSEQAPL